MDSAKLFNACRIGDIELVKTLIETKDLELNIRDPWDCSPLYYACLCGHKELVRYLLSNGAICDANTFDGERCIYGALTDEIRNILVREYQVLSKKVSQRHEFDEMLRLAFESGKYHDVVFHVHGVCFQLHKCILAARSTYFEYKFSDKWRNCEDIYLNNHLVDSECFFIMLRFIYTGVLEFKILQNKVALVRLLRKCRLNYALDAINKEFSQFSGKSKSKWKQKSILIELPVITDYYRLFHTCVPKPIFELNDTKWTPLCEGFSDIIFEVNGHRYPCHKMFFCTRSDYLLALTQDYFTESKVNSDQVPVYQLTEISNKTFEALACYVYTNHTELSLEIAIDLLFLADLYLMSTLKKYCADVIGNHVNVENAIEMIQTARTFNLTKLEKTATEFIAKNLDQFLQCNKFQHLIISDAQAIKERQETDTIDIIDDIRYYLSHSAIKTHTSAEKQFQAIDSLLAKLGLDA